MIGYVARDRSGEVYLHVEKPTYNDGLESWYSTPEIINITGEFDEFDNMSKIDVFKVEIKLERI